MSAKQIMMGLLISVFCCACANFQNLAKTYEGDIYYGDNFTKNTPFVTQQDPGKVGYQDHNGRNIPGQYDEYFNIISANPSSVEPAFSYQLMYHHPGDLTADTYTYYLALVNIRQDNLEETTVLQATLNGKSLPVAAKLRKFAGKKSYVHAIDLLLKRDQLIRAYEVSEKLVIFVQVGDKTYDIVFPNKYLLNVLAKTTNIEKYKRAWSLAHPQ